MKSPLSTYGFLVIAILFAALGFLSLPHNANAFSCTGTSPSCSQLWVPAGQCNAPACFDTSGCTNQPGCTGTWGCVVVTGSCGGPGGGGGGGGGFSWWPSVTANPSSGTAPLSSNITGTFNFSGLTAATITQLTYEFDCNGDGVFEQSYVQTSGFSNYSDSHAVSCNYSQGGTYAPIFRGTFDFSNGDHRSAITQTYVDVAPGTGNIQEYANLDGASWTGQSFGEVYDAPYGANQTATLNPPQTFTNLQSGTYTVKSMTWPAGVTLHDINGSSLPYSQTLIGGNTITFNRNFVSDTGNIQINAFKDGVLWNTSFQENYTHFYPYGGSWTGNTTLNPQQTLFNVTTGTYQVNSVVNPPGVTLQSINGSPVPPSYSQTLTKGSTITFNYYFVSNNQLPTGNHDSTDNASCYTYGWATDPDNTSIPLKVNLYSNISGFIKVITANQYRGDLTGVCSGSGGFCSFSTSLSGFISTGVTQNITATAIDAQTGQEVNLQNTPKSITCPAFNYSLSASNNITVTQGSSGSNTITRTLIAGTSQSVSLSASGLPSGATASFSPTSCNPTCSTTLAIATLASTPPGSYVITVTGSPLGKTTTFTLTVASSGTVLINATQNSSATSNSLTANWSGATDNIAVTGYRLDVSTASTFTSFVTGYNNLDVGNVTSKLISGLSPSTTYYARVRAYDAAGNISANSNTVSLATTP